MIHRRTRKRRQESRSTSWRTTWSTSSNVSKSFASPKACSDQSALLCFLKGQREVRAMSHHIVSEVHQMCLIVPLQAVGTCQTTRRRTDSNTSLQWPKTRQGAEQESLREPVSNRPTTAIEAMIEGSRAAIASSHPIYRRRVQESGLDRLIIGSAPLAPKTTLTASIEPVAAKKGKVRASQVRATAFIVRLAACACPDRTTWGMETHRRLMQPAWE